MNNKNRQGRITSSNAYKLIKPGKNKNDVFSAPALTYIQEKQIERRINSCLDADGAYSQAMAWGNFCEMVIYSLLGIEYEISSKETFLHPKHSKIWAGSPDLKIDGVLIGEIKCYQKKKFALYTDLLIRPLSDTYTLENKLEDFKKEFPAEYWQIVSNASILGVKEGEAITYMPYESEYKEIVDLAENMDSAELWKYRFITEKPVDQLPFLPNGGYYKNINKFRFKIPAEDFELLEKKVVLAGELIKNWKP